ncbi:MAG: xanthine dehydrogenase family protein subunit M [Alphaproteobacteria bacterium]
MQRFSFERAKTARDAAISAQSDNCRFIAGGTNLIDYMKLGVERPEALIDINSLAQGDPGTIRANPEELRLGALVRMADAEAHPEIRRSYPVIVDALRLAASPQIRAMASLGGNVLQRTRCEYLRERSWPCNRRDPGSGCAAFNGINREHAILGVSDACIAAYPGDLAQALIVLDATVETMSRGGGRIIAFADLHRPPGNSPEIETILDPGELITFFSVPAGPHTRRSRFVKIRDRASYQFAQASTAVALDLDGDIVRDVRIALGGVATVPWRARQSEALLRGRKLDEAAARDAAECAFADAETRDRNGFKLTLGRQTVMRALLETVTMEIGDG